MSESVQADYERRLTAYGGLIHGNNPPGLAAKLAVYAELLRQHRLWGEQQLWRIEPLIYPLTKSVEVDLHLSMARLLEPPNRSQSSLFKFLSFCEGNRARIRWPDGPLSSTLLTSQLVALEAHCTTVQAIMGRRDQFFAHLDKRYFFDSEAVFDDYPLEENDVIDLANAMIRIIADHQGGLGGPINIHLAEFYTISVDNMVRNLRTGRQVNFPNNDQPL